MYTFAVIVLISFVLSTSATPLQPSTALHTTGTHRPGTYGPGCFYEGSFYPPGEIKRGSDGMGWCYGTVCDKSGSVYVWDDFSCTTTSLPTTPTTPRETTPFSSALPPTTTSNNILLPKTLPPASPATAQSPRPPSPSTPPGCVYNGQLHPPGKILQVPDGNGTWCFRVVCNESGNVYHWNNYSCATTNPHGFSSHNGDGLRPTNALLCLCVISIMYALLGVI